MTANDRSRRDVFLQLYRETTSDCLDDTSGAAFLAELRIAMIVMRVSHVLGDNFIFQQGPFGHQHPWGLNSADELVPGENNRVFVHGCLPDAGQMWIHIDLNVRGWKIDADFF